MTKQELTTRLLSLEQLARPPPKLMAKARPQGLSCVLPRGGVPSSPSTRTLPLAQVEEAGMLGRPFP